MCVCDTENTGTFALTDGDTVEGFSKACAYSFKNAHAIT